jgi:hypothetical protein
MRDTTEKNPHAVALGRLGGAATKGISASVALRETRASLHDPTLVRAPHRLPWSRLEPSVMRPHERYRSQSRGAAAACPAHERRCPMSTPKPDGRRKRAPKTERPLLTIEEAVSLPGFRYRSLLQWEGGEVAS